MKAKITFNGFHIAVDAELNNISKYTVAFTLSEEFKNPFVIAILDKMGANIGILSNGVYVIMKRDRVTLTFHN